MVLAAPPFTSQGECSVSGAANSAVLENSTALLGGSTWAGWLLVILLGTQSIFLGFSLFSQAQIGENAPNTIKVMKT